MILRVSRATFNEIAVLLCSGGQERRCRAKPTTEQHGAVERQVQDGPITCIDLRGLYLELVK